MYTYRILRSLGFRVNILGSKKSQTNVTNVIIDANEVIKIIVIKVE